MGFPIRGIRKYVATMVATYFLMPLIGKPIPDPHFPIRYEESRVGKEVRGRLKLRLALYRSNGFSNQGHQEVRRHHGGDVLPDAPDWKTHSRSSLSNKIRRESCRERGQR